MQPKVEDILKELSQVLSLGTALLMCKEAFLISFCIKRIRCADGCDFEFWKGVVL